VQEGHRGHQIMSNDKPLPGGLPMRDPAESFKKLNPQWFAAEHPLKLQTPATLSTRPTTDEANLNKTERDYLTWLRTMKDQWIGIQCLTFKLAHDCRYTPDFFALDDTGLRAIDCKGGHTWEDSLIKARVAARLFPWCRFIIAKKNRHVWEHTEIRP
jgi:hypothetical protein